MNCFLVGLLFQDPLLSIPITFIYAIGYITKLKRGRVLDYLTIGHYSIHTELLALFLSILLVSILYKSLMKTALHDWYLNSFLLMIAIYKGSYILFYFNLFLDTPLSIIYFNGGWKGWLLAYGGLILYLLLSRKSKMWIRLEFRSAYLLFLFTYNGLLQVFDLNLLASGIHIIMLFTLMLAFKWDKTFNPRYSKQMFFVYLLIETLLISLYANLLNLQTLLMIIVGIIMVFVKNDLKEENR